MPPRVPRDDEMPGGREAVRPVLKMRRGGGAAGKLADRFGPTRENNGRQISRMRRAAHRAGPAGPVHRQGRDQSRVVPAAKRPPSGRGAGEAARTRTKKRAARRLRGGPL